MKRNHLPSLLLVLALVLVATAAQAAGSAPASPAAPQASVTAPAAATITPAVTALSSTPAWNPVILAGLPVPGQVKTALPPEFLPPSFCPPPCIGCIAPHRCVAPCQTHSGCTICSCS